jgi:hypothetical protein
VIKRVLPLLAALSAVHCDTIRYWEYRQVLAELGRIPNVRVVESGGNEDVTLEDIYATIEIQDKGKIGFFQLERSSFSQASMLLVWQVGDYFPMVVSYGEQGVVKTSTREPVKTIGIGRGIGLEAGSPFAALFDAEFHRVQDVVAGYDGLVSVLSTWPVCPDSAALSESHRMEYRYCVNRTQDSLVEPVYPSEWFPCSDGGDCSD